MNYIIADSEDKSGVELKKILDFYGVLVFHGRFTTFEVAADSIRRDPPDIAFIRIGNAKLNAFKLVSEIKEKAPFSKVIFMSSHAEDAVQAFEYNGDGFLLIPYDEEKIRHTLMRCIELRRD